MRNRHASNPSLLHAKLNTFFFLTEFGLIALYYESPDYVICHCQVQETRYRTMKQIDWEPQKQGMIRIVKIANCSNLPQRTNAASKTSFNILDELFPRRPAATVGSCYLKDTAWQIRREYSQMFHMLNLADMFVLSYSRTLWTLT